MTSMKHFEFDSIMCPFNKKNAIEIIVGQHQVEDYVKYINENSIEQASVAMPNIEFLKLCPTLKYLYIVPSYNATSKFSFESIYEMKQVKFLNCQNVYGEREEFCAEVDFARLQNLEFLSVTYNKGVLNLSNLIYLKTLVIWDFKNKEKNLKSLIGSKILDSLELNSSKIQSLDGIEQSENMQCLYINYNRSLKDISALKKVKETLKALHIENCPKIEDFSVLSELENLEYLALIGSNNITDLKFIDNMKNLKTFIFDVNILDGDLSPCLQLNYVYSGKNRKHYNLKDDDLPKGEYVCGNEDIEEWRRLE